MKTKVITDSISDISRDVAANYDIEVLPILISTDGPYVSSDEVDTQDVINWIRENKKIPSFKGISTETYARTFEKYINEGMEILYITKSRGRISNYDTACHASTRFPAANIQVIDSKRLSSNIGLMAVKAATMANEDVSANGIVINFERTMHKFKQFDLTDTLEFLDYSKAVPKMAAARNSMFNSKFMLASHEEGDMHTEMLGHSMDKALANYISLVFKDLKAIDPKRIFLSHTISDNDYFASLYKHVVSLEYFEDIIASESGSYSSSFVGPNSINVAYQLK